MSCDALIKVLNEARRRLAHHDNDFAWSRWNSADEAVAELDDFIRRMDAGETVKLFDLEMLFAPTGSLQKVSVSSGWGDEFVLLASRFDEACRHL